MSVATISETNRLVNLTWNLRSQLDQVSEQLQILQKQRTQLVTYTKQLENKLCFYEEKLARYKGFSFSIAIFAVFFIICWMKQRKSFNELLGQSHHQSLSQTSNRIITEEIHQDISLTFEQTNKIQPIPFHVDEFTKEENDNGVADEIFDKSNPLYDQIQPELDFMASSDEEEKNQAEEDLNEDDEILNGTITLDSFAQSILSLSENIQLTESENSTEGNSHESNEIIVNAAVLPLVQQLRRELEDYQALLRLNENAELMQARSPTKKRSLSTLGSPEYLKFRTKNPISFRRSVL